MSCSYTLIDNREDMQQPALHSHSSPERSNRQLSRSDSSENARAWEDRRHWHRSAASWAACKGTCADSRTCAPELRRTSPAPERFRHSSRWLCRARGPGNRLGGRGWQVERSKSVPLQLTSHAGKDERPTLTRAEEKAMYISLPGLPKNGLRPVCVACLHRTIPLILSSATLCTNCLLQCWHQPSSDPAPSSNPNLKSSIRLCHSLSRAVCCKTTTATTHPPRRQQHNRLTWGCAAPPSA
eukprot:358404-Chlamydomonas_euryale.AAC.12